MRNEETLMAHPPGETVYYDLKIIEYLNQLGIHDTFKLHYNPSFEQLREDELSKDLLGCEKAQLTRLGATAVETGAFTGRSPKDKYFVYDEITARTVWWKKEDAFSDNQAITPKIWESLYQITTQQLTSKTLYVVDAFCGANENSRLKVRFVMEVAWQAHFVKNMFIRPSEEELETFEPDFVVLNASKAINPQWQQQGLHSENFVAFNLTERVQIIGGTWYGGEMKKGLFTLMNFYLPQQGIASMHSSANIGSKGDVALFFGLSGTGKTTLSADPNRLLIGDDEHGWDDQGIFNLEGGCYAKTIDLDPEKEPDIYQAIRPNALLENVIVNEQGDVDFSDVSLTENTRVSYPIEHIKNCVKPHSRGNHAENIIFLTADAFGVLPPVAKLTLDQAKYHYLSGFTTKMSGTERGIDKPQPTFSACFGQAFLSLPPLTYAEVLGKRIQTSGAHIYLVNTGWNGQGQRISLKNTRRIINAIFNGNLQETSWDILPMFNLQIPTELAGIDKKLLDPRKSYEDIDDWYRKAMDLGLLFVKNFERFTNTEEGKQLTDAGPSLGY